MMKTRYDKDAADFLPDALAVRNERLPGWARSGILLMFVFFGLAVAWAVMCRVDVIVEAAGKLVSDHQTIVMKPLERTVIKGVHVAVGDRVKAGQVLVTFDPVFSESDRDRLAMEIRVYESQFNRLSAEYEGRELVLPEKPTEEELWQRSIYEGRRQFYAEKMAYFEKDLDRIAKSREAISKNLEVQRDRLAGYHEIEKMHERAMRSSAGSLRQVKETQLARMELEADISDKSHNMLALNSEYLSRQAEREAFRREWNIQTAEEMVKARENLIRARKEYDKAFQLTSYVELRAPEDAVVHDIAPLSIGSAVREAETLVTLVPLGGTLEVDAMIRAGDIGKVKTGDSVRVKVTAFPFQKHGTLEGVVRVLSEDAFTQPAAGEGAQGQGGAFYRARIAFDTGKNARSSLPPRLIPGMETQCEIRVGSRRVIEYLTHPIIKSLDEAIREP
jgi:HlyD family secretion protein